MVSTLVIGLVGASGVAVAEQPYDIVDSTTDDGTYVARSLTSTYDEAAWAPAIERARAAGVDLRVLAPADPVPDAAAFALRVRQLADADAVIVFDPEGQLFADVNEDWSDGRYRALVASRDATDPVAAVDVYVAELTTEPVAETPALVRRLAVIVFLLLLVLGALTFAEMTLRQRRARQRAAHRSLHDSGASA